MDEQQPRLVITTLCQQTRAETGRLRYFAANTFVFQAAARNDYGCLEEMFNWLHGLTKEERRAIGKLVVCSKKPQGMVSWAIKLAEYCDMDFGFKVVKRIDEEVIEIKEDEHGNTQEKVTTMVPWGKDCGHFCTSMHYELTHKKNLKMAAGKVKKMLPKLEPAHE